MKVTELDYRTDDKIYADYLKFYKINPNYGPFISDNDLLTESQLQALKKLINIVDRLHVIDRPGFTIEKNVLEVYSVSSLSEITQGIYRGRVLSFVMLYDPYFWMNNLERSQMISSHMCDLII